MLHQVHMLTFHLWKDGIKYNSDKGHLRALSYVLLEQEKKVNTWISHPENLASGEKNYKQYLGVIACPHSKTLILADDGFL